MSLNWAENNHNYVPAYQQSGIPFVTSSAAMDLINEGPKEEGATSGFVKIEFPYVTRWIMVRNIGEGGLRVGFTALGTTGPKPRVDSFQGPTGSNANYFLLAGTGSAGNGFSLHGATNMFGPVEVKCTALYFAGHDTDTATGFSLMAGYTNIPESQFLRITGSSGFWGVG